MYLTPDSKYAYGLHWAHSKAEGWMIIRIWNNTRTDMVRLVEFGPVPRPKTLLQKIRDRFNGASFASSTPDIITLRDACTRFDFIAPDTIEVPAALQQLEKNGWTVE